MENQNNRFGFNWGTQTPLYYSDVTYGIIGIVATGACYYRIDNPSVNKEQVKAQIYQKIISSIAKMLNNTRHPNYNSALELVKMSGQSIAMAINSELQSGQYAVEQIVFNSVTLDEKSRQMILGGASGEATQNLSTIQQTQEFNDVNKVTVVKTDEGAKDGQNKCPKCGATDISVNVNTGRLRCNFCRYEFEPEKVVGLETDISKLQGQIMGSGAQDIVADTNDILTFKCSSCGAEVVIDTSEATHARCHWCRNTLSVNQQVPNGSVPDVVLPFNLNKEDAKAEIEKFVRKRKFFAHPKFKKEFTTENIMGVYFPYMIVDVNAHSNLSGQGEHLIRSYTVKSGDHTNTYYDADLYDVQREFDILIEGLTVESSSDKLDKNASNKTNNVINAIMPFDIENAVKWNANYLKGYTSEKRDTNVEDLRNLVEVQSKDIARFAANDTLLFYDRGVKWDSEYMEIKGQQWKAAYLPVWLYSYQQVKGDKKLLHYVAVNARTKETMGSVPIHMPKLWGMASLVETFGFALMMYGDGENDWIFLSVGFIYFFLMYTRYRNKNARHTHELETKKNIGNVRKVDEFVKSKKRLDRPYMQGANNTNVTGQSFSETMYKDLMRGNGVARLIRDKMVKKDNK